MLNYNERLNEAWEKVPEQHKKQLLEELEHKAYNQDFIEYTKEDEDNILAPIVDAFIDCIKVLIEKIF